MVVSDVVPCSNTSPLAIGNKSPSGDTPQGLIDMSGNINEWNSYTWESDSSIASNTDRYNFTNDLNTSFFVDLV